MLSRSHAPVHMNTHTHYPPAPPKPNKQAGEKIDVKLLGINEKGQLRLSRKALLEDEGAAGDVKRKVGGDKPAGDGSGGGGGEGRKGPPRNNKGPPAARKEAAAEAAAP